LCLDAAVTLEQLEGMTDAERLMQLHAPDLLLADCPLIRLDGDEAGKLLAGMRRRTVAAPTRRACGPLARSRAPFWAAPGWPAAN
jgi:tRNA pseudouridine55 synthase